MLFAHIVVLLKPDLLIAGAMGLASGLPLMLTGGLLQAYMKSEGIDLGVIGMTSLLGLPYTLKFLWAPFLDRYMPIPLGRRKGWLLIFQLGLIASIALMGLVRPCESLPLLCAITFLVTFLSASQDIVVDAYRRETLNDKELGLGSAYYIYGYRLGMLISGAGGLIMADLLSFRVTYLVMAGSLVPFLLLSLLIREPMVKDTPATLKEAVISPIRELLGRNGVWFLMLFVILFKLGDNMAGNMTIPFLLEVGFTRTQIGVVAKLMGFWATLIGAFMGGLLLMKWPFRPCLILFGVLQAVSTFLFTLLINTGPRESVLFLVIGLENLTAGMGTSGLTAFMAKATNKRFTATQYALLSSLMGIPRVIGSAPAGLFAASMGWWWFFTFSTFIAIPAIIILAFTDTAETP